MSSGTSSRKAAKMLRKQYEYEVRYRPGLNTEIMRGRMADAQEFGIHPLVMAGIDPGGGGGFQMPAIGGDNTGQAVAEAGRIAGRSVENRGYAKLNKERLQAEIELLKAQATSLGQRPPQDPAPGMPGQNVPSGVVPQIDPATQEIEKAKVGTHAKGNPQKGMGVKPLTQGITVGDQTIQFAVEDAADIAEDPAKIIMAAVLDRSNTGVQWRKAIRDYAGMQHPRDYKARNLAERVITKKVLWGLVKLKKHWAIPRFMGR